MEDMTLQHQILGWAGYVRIDGASYEWLGAATTYGSATNLTATTITPTRTVFTIHAGPMDLNVTFLSPIEVRRRRNCPLYPVNEVLMGESLEIGLCNRYHSRTCILRLGRRTGTRIASRCTQTLPQVR